MFFLLFCCHWFSFCAYRVWFAAPTVLDEEKDNRGRSGLKMTYNPLFTSGSRDPSAESVTSLISTSTGNSISPQGTTQRPHSITSKSIVTKREAFLFYTILQHFCSALFF